MRFTFYGKFLLEILDDEDYDREASVAEAKAAVKQYVKVPLTNNQFSALVSFIVCEGVETFRKSKILSLINASKKDWHNFLKAADQFDRHIYTTDVHGRRSADPFLIEHRRLEKELFLTPEEVKK